MNITFSLRFSTKPGQHLFICGNIPELGYQDKSTITPMLMKYLNPDFWELSIDLAGLPDEPLNYYYQLGMEDGSTVYEWGNDRTVEISAKFSNIHFIDTWNQAGEFENAFYTAPFQQILLPSGKKRHGSKQPKFFTHIFKVKAPLISASEVLCISGSSKSMGEWSMSNPQIMRKSGNWWTIALDMSEEGFPVLYKYGVYDVKHKSIIRYESESNRVVQGKDRSDCLTILQDGFAHLPNTTWKGAGVSIPVFSLRSKDSMGAGEFSDIRLLVDWAVKTGMKMIQLLPVNDTSNTNTWIDSYPYASISAFALHPLYLNIHEMAGKKNAAYIKSFKKLQKQLNSLPDVDYEKVMQTKIAASKELFNLEKEQFLDDPHFKIFFILDMLSGSLCRLLLSQGNKWQSGLF